MTFAKRGVVVLLSAGMVLCFGQMLLAQAAPAAPAASAPAPAASPAPAAPAPAPAAPAAPAPAPAADSTAGETVVIMPPGAVATVNGEPIPEQEWLDALRKTYGTAVLEVMINHMVVRQAAAKAGVTLTDAEMQAELDKAVTQAGGKEGLISKLNEIGESVDDYQEVLRTSALLRKLVEPSLTITEEDLKNTYLEQYGPKADVQVIVVGTLPEADQVIPEARRGADFAELALKFSTDNYTKGNHAFLPAPLSKGFFPKPFGNVTVTRNMADAIFNLKQGEVSDPIQTQDGFYIFKVVALYSARDVKFETVKDQVRSDFREMKLSSEAQQYLQMLVRSADIRINSAQGIPQ